MSDSIQDQLIKDMEKLEEYQLSTHNRRLKVIDKLEATVDAMILDPNNEKASVIEAKMGIINTYLSAVDSTDKQKMELFKTKAKIKSDSDSQDAIKMVSSMVAEYIKKLDNTSPIITTSSTSSMDEVDKLMETQASSENFEILDTELQFGDGGEAFKIINEVAKLDKKTEVTA